MRRSTTIFIASISSVLIVALGLLIWFGYSFSKKRVSQNGFSFSYPKRLVVQQSRSADGDYINLQLTGRQNSKNSSIIVSLPLKNASQYSSLADMVKNLVDPTKISPVNINGHTGQTINYQLDETSDPSTSRTMHVTQIALPTRYTLSALLLIYSQTDRELSLLPAWKSIIDSLRYSGSYNYISPGDPDFQFMSQLSTPNHPVFISKKYHFEYSPTGNYGYSKEKVLGTQQLAVSVTSHDNNDTNSNLSLFVFKNDNNVGTGSVDQFRQWRKANIYDNATDPIEIQKISLNTFYKATQVDGIDSKSLYYYLIRPDYIYVFVRGLDNPNIGILGNLNVFTLTP